MPERNPNTPLSNGNRLRDDWLRQLKQLLDSIGAWAMDEGWATRGVEKRMEDSEAGAYRAPALLLQQDTVRVIVEPIARTAPGVEGVVDIYLLPAYDDIASLYFTNGRWQLHYLFPDQPTPPVVTPKSGKAQPLTKESFARVLNAMMKNAV